MTEHVISVQGRAFIAYFNCVVFEFALNLKHAWVVLIMEDNYAA